MYYENRKIPNRLRKHRKMMGLTQQEVVDILGIKKTNRLSQWENGELYPSVINLIKLSIIYHVFPTDLYYNLMCILRDEMKERLHSAQINTRPDSPD